MICSALVALLMVFCLAPIAFAQEKATAPSSPYSGDLWSRSTVTGDWSGTRTELAAKGVTFDLSLTQAGQSVVSGGREIGWKYGGRGEGVLDLDFQKVGLRPSGFLLLRAEGNFAESVNERTGALMSVNNNADFPDPGKNELLLPHLVYTQFIIKTLAVFIGKLDTTGSDFNDFAHSKGDDQFLNTAFNLNPVTLLTTPYSTLGAGVLFMLDKQIAATFSVYETNGRPDTFGSDTLLNGGTTLAAEVRFATSFFRLPGHQLFGALYSDQSFVSLDQSLSTPLCQ